MIYFLYVRKSTDVEDKQVRSIEDQLAVLRALAKEQGLVITEEFIEKQSAKRPGRPVFANMLRRIEQGEAQGILCWKLDRLARNPVDAAQISWLLQEGIIQNIQTHDRVYRSADNVLMMSVEFGMANQYVRDLSTNVKRALNEKVKRGEYPSFAPVGYMNDLRTKTIIVDRKNAKIVREAFELYAEGNSRLEDIATLFAKNGIVSGGGRPLKRDRISYTLSNPIYYGHFRYAGELYEGKHTPLISKKLWDKAQAVLKERGRPQYKMENDPRPLCGLLKCGECGCGITAEMKTKHQKNGNLHNYTYYRCTKKKGHCSQPCIREEVLATELSETIKPYALPSDWAAELLKLADADERESVQSSATASQALRDEITAISQKLQRLLAAYLDQDIEREAYRSEKANLLSRKKSLEGQIVELGQGTIAWLEPLRGWIKDAENVGESVASPSLYAKKSSAQKIFGSNLFLKNRLLVSTPTPPYASLREARLNFSETGDCMILVAPRGIEPRFTP
jgi:site-specific DNA recombinase